MTLYYCLYYNSGAEGAIWKGVETATPDVTCNIFGSDAYGSNESGQYGGGNAASAENPSGSCNVGIWANAHYQGGSNWLSPGWGGNRAWFLKNAEHSIAVADTWDCPGVGIG